VNSSQEWWQINVVGHSPTFLKDGKWSDVANAMDLQLDLREGVLTKAMNNGTRGTRGFR
jgi:hypothetical protein